MEGRARRHGRGIHRQTDGNGPSDRKFRRCGTERSAITGKTGIRGRAIVRRVIVAIPPSLGNEQRKNGRGGPCEGRMSARKDTVSRVRVDQPTLIWIYSRLCSMRGVSKGGDLSEFGIRMSAGSDAVALRRRTAC